MSEEFNKEFMKLSEKDQKSILNLIQLKNMNKQTEYKRRIDKAIEYIKELYDNTDDITCYDIDKNTKKELLKMLGENNNE